MFDLVRRIAKLAYQWAIVFYKLARIRLSVQLWVAKRQLARLRKEKADSQRELVLYRMAVIGGLALAWAKLEATFDEVNELAFFNGAKEAVEKRLPKSLNRKLDFIRRSHRKLPWLVGLQAEGDRIFDQVEGLSEDRHQLIHGVVESLSTADVLKLVRNAYGDTGLNKVEKGFSGEALIELAEGIIRCSHLLADHLGAMNNALLQYRLDYLKR